VRRNQNKEEVKTMNENQTPSDISPVFRKLQNEAVVGADAPVNVPAEVGNLSGGESAINHPTRG
jgi:hypothetical protein